MDVWRIKVDQWMDGKKAEGEIGKVREIMEGGIAPQNLKSLSGGEYGADPNFLFF